MTNEFNIPAPTENETSDAKRIRRTAEYDHTHTLDGHHLSLAPTQDAAGANCSECGRTIEPRNATWQHSLQCSLYSPQLNSIAGQPGYLA